MKDVGHKLFMSLKFSHVCSEQLSSIQTHKTCFSLIILEFDSIVLRKLSSLGYMEFMECHLGLEKAGSKFM
jgi:hypothetical protein